MRYRWICLRLLFLLVLLFGGLGELRAEVSEPDSLRGEHIGAFDTETLERSFGLVRFRSSAQARYALDLGDESWYLGSVKMDAFYKEFATEYTAPWKLIPLGERDVVEAYYEGKVIGKLRVVSYPKQNYRVRLVPVNGQSLGDVSRLSQQLNSIYNKHGVSFTLSEAEGVSAELKSKSLSQDLRTLRDDYEAQHSLSGNEVCIFILSAELSKGSKYEELEGLMPRGKRFGYIFASNSPNEEALARTLAHELGHGLFTLQHTFDNEYGGKKSRGKTQNLMDYTEGATELAAFQWNVMANTAPFTALDREKEGQLIKMITSKTHQNLITPNGELIAEYKPLKNNCTISILIKKGSPYVYGFKIIDKSSNSTIDTYRWSNNTFTNSNGTTIEAATNIEITYNKTEEIITATILESFGDPCFYAYSQIPYTSNVLIEGSMYFHRSSKQ